MGKKEHFGLRYEEFLTHTESICEVEEHRVCEQAKTYTNELHKPIYNRYRN